MQQQKPCRGHYAAMTFALGARNKRKGGTGGPMPAARCFDLAGRINYSRSP
jgi:hypothetical protein